MMHGWRFVVAISLEMVLFLGSMWLGALQPERLNPMPDHVGLEVSQPVGFTCAALIIGLAVQLVYHHYVRTAVALNRSNEALREAARNKDAFMALIAHELKTPVAIMANHAQEAARMLATVDHQSGELDRAKKDMETILRQSASLAGMVTQLLDISRINDGRLNMNITRVQLSEVVQETMAECAHLFARTGNVLRLAPGGAHPTVTGDRARINRALLNLLSNASRHTQNGTVTISLAKEDGFARVTVRDTGEGMSAEQIQQVLAAAAVGTGDEFRIPSPVARTLRRLPGARRRSAAPSPDGRERGRKRGRGRPAEASKAGPATPAEAPVPAAGAAAAPEGAATATTRTTPDDGRFPVATGSDHGGLGLGLRIVQHTITAQGGTFALASEPGEGTTASFTLPLAPPLPPN
jgi:signal transduction histidine kinase